jgi:CRISPR/Cas system-associated exonuclease Cas4 (RecB family)
MSSNIVKRALDAFATSVSKVWSHDRSNTVGASEVGQCIRKIYWLKSENDSRYKVARDPDYSETWGARMRGTVYEDCFWEPAMRAMFGDRLHFAGRDQRTFVSDYLSATPDGLIYRLNKQERDAIGIDGNCVTVECKTSDPRTELSHAKPVNVFQTQVQMGLIREHTPMTPTHSILSYTDASFWNEVKEFVIEYDQNVYEVAKKRAMTIMTATDLNNIPPEGWIAGGSECRYCPFTIACGIERRNLPFQDSEVDPQFAAEMRDMALSYRTMEKSRDGLDSEARALQDQIKQRLREKGVRKIPGLLTWSAVKGRAGYDNKQIKQAALDAGIDVEKFKTIGEPTDRLVITIDP